MNEQVKPPTSTPALATFLLLFGCLLIGFGWLVPSRFNSIPYGVLQEAGAAGGGVGDAARSALADGNLGAASLLASAAQRVGDQGSVLVMSRVAMEREASAQISRWGAWDPFLDAALGSVPLSSYSDQPGAFGILVSRPCLDAVRNLLSGSRDPLTRDILATGPLRTYKRLPPIVSAGGRPLEATLLGVALLAQGDHFHPSFKAELRELVWQANSSGEAGLLEDVYLDALSLMRLFDWGQLRALVGKIESADSLSRLRYLFHRRPDDLAMTYAMAVSGSSAAGFLDYLGDLGDEGYDLLERSLGQGILAFQLVVREGLPVELRDSTGPQTLFERGQAALAPYCLQQPQLWLTIKYGSFFLGAYIALVGASRYGRFYQESVTPALAYTQRFFGATALLIVLAVLSEPHLASARDAVGYSFRLVMPVLAQVDGETQIIETTPSVSMETATLLSIAFFFFLQVLVFLICLLKVREIERRMLDPLVKLKLMENEDNLFDSGLYVGIAGTCVALVVQVMGLVEANLIAAYSSNLFGILSVAIVKIRLVRPYKTRLIMLSEAQIVEAAAAARA